MTENSLLWVPLKEHFDALREADDRRYRDVSAEREKALRIKEAADEKALNLARDIQVYKDEKANELRSQIESERGSYASQTQLRAAVEKLELGLKTLDDKIEAIAKQITRGSGIGEGAKMILWFISGAIATAATTATLIALWRS